MGVSFMSSCSGGSYSRSATPDTNSYNDITMDYDVK